MGLGTNAARPKYLSIFNGKIIQKVFNDTPGAINRTNKQGVEVYELIFDYVEGLLTGITVEEVAIAGQDMKFWALTIVDKDEKYKLSFPYRSGPATCFLMCIQKIDVQRPIMFIPAIKDIVKGNSTVKKISLFFKQEGKISKWAYTKDNPGDLPPMREIIFKGEKKWDDTEQMAFLVKQMNEKVIPNLPRVDVDIHMDQIKEEILGVYEEEHGDSLPF